MKLSFSYDDVISVFSVCAYQEMTAVGFILAHTRLRDSRKFNAQYLLQAIPSSLELVPNGVFLCQNRRLRIFHDGQSLINFFLRCNRVSAKVTFVEFYTEKCKVSKPMFLLFSLPQPIHARSSKRNTFSTHVSTFRLAHTIS